MPRQEEEPSIPELGNLRSDLSHIELSPLVEFKSPIESILSSRSRRGRRRFGRRRFI